MKLSIVIAAVLVVNVVFSQPPGGGSGMMGGSGHSMGGSGHSNGGSGSSMAGGSSGHSMGSSGMSMGPGQMNNGFSSDQRTYTPTVSGTGVQFTGALSGSSTSSGRSDSVSFSCDNSPSTSGQWMSFGMNYNKNTGTGSGSGTSTSDAGINVGVCGLVEFTESGASAGYDSADTLVFTSPDPSFSSFSSQSTGSSDYTMMSSYSSDGHFQVNIYVSGTGATLAEGVSISSNEMKFDILIKNHIYRSNHSQIALCVSLSSSNNAGSVSQYTSGSSLTGFTAASTNGETQGYFSWTGTASTGTGDANIIATTNGGNAYFTFNCSGQPTNFTWDPTVGVSGTTTSSNGASGIGLSIVGFFAAVLAWFY